ncbi:uncharacterized protein LOC132716121 [Ruditapes philippinarum]|uniref:uncharacterized protein LOC132716121 n=1 Tax=Ruditapes philippinarum TaxID=129788 RepID=UPI00295AFB7D|nr:uncharacterized protein LOC132716121 [Ruditapes philippinarum]
MATEHSGDDSSEKLLQEPDEETPLGEDEEDCVKLLLNALGKDDDDNENDGNVASGEEKRLLANDSGAGRKLRLRDYTDTGVESVNTSVGELNASRAKLDMPTVRLSSNGKEMNFTKTPSPFQERQKRAMKLLKKHRSDTGKIVCGVVVMLIILGIGGGLLVLGWINNMEDLYLLGGIFSFGGVLFAIALVVVRCQAREQLEDTDYSVLYKT